ncbi:Transmembrane emp24 domain-containing protein 5-like [Oopsacas minuta]|uniref:Transmembrane emp24 domain-containing protein 5-like n=1 Tax=Oopsacas minuta TaxID=111878 RepID=A0AAV7JKA3_9METZ|nr:Transmembrane emp24 domain-containing protein 5-like [Oopsacas minuta]
MNKKINIFLLLISFMVNCVLSKSYTFTVKISARDSLCLYQPMTEGNYMEVDFQVIEGGALDIDCHIKSSNLRSFKSFNRLSEGYHTFVADKTGDYAVCLDNTHSTLVAKLVYLILETNAEDELEDLNLSEETISNYELDGQVENIETKLRNIGHALNLIITQQRHFRGREARHRKTAESNYTRVNYFSIAQIIVLIIIAGVQVGMVRVFFRERKGQRI